ncbi:MAG: hypothetical protein AB1938_27440 [Myxococcota bacterium]
MDAELAAHLDATRRRLADVEARHAERTRREQAELLALENRAAALRAQVEEAEAGLPVAHERRRAAEEALSRLTFAATDRVWAAVWAGLAGTLACASAAMWVLMGKELFLGIGVQVSGFFAGYLAGHAWWRGGRRGP